MADEYEIISISPLPDSDWWVVYELDFGNLEKDEVTLVRERAIGIILYKSPIGNGETCQAVVFLPQNIAELAIPEELETSNQRGIFRLTDTVNGQKVSKIKEVN